jgi:hypothetical protein
MPREPLDAVENPPKETPCQVALGQLKHEVPSMPDEVPAGLEQPLLDVTAPLSRLGFFTSQNSCKYSWHLIRLNRYTAYRATVGSRGAAPRWGRDKE